MNTLNFMYSKYGHNVCNSRRRGVRVLVWNSSVPHRSMIESNIRRVCDFRLLAFGTLSSKLNIWKRRYQLKMGSWGAVKREFA